MASWESSSGLTASCIGRASTVPKRPKSNPTMNTFEILATIDAEIARLEKAKALLNGNTTAGAGCWISSTDRFLQLVAKDEHLRIGPATEIQQTNHTVAFSIWLDHKTNPLTLSRELSYLHIMLHFRKSPSISTRHAPPHQQFNDSPRTSRGALSASGVYRVALPLKVFRARPIIAGG
jgi:hypothetical protein